MTSAHLGKKQARGLLRAWRGYVRATRRPIKKNATGEISARVGAVKLNLCRYKLFASEQNAANCVANCTKMGTKTVVHLLAFGLQRTRTPPRSVVTHPERAPASSDVDLERYDIRTTAEGDNSPWN